MTTKPTPAPSRGRHGPRDLGGPEDVRRVTVTLPCTSCLGDVAGSSFRYLSSAHRLVHARCPSCRRSMTLPVATWRRWTTSAPHRRGRTPAHPAGRSPVEHLLSLTGT